MIQQHQEMPGFPADVCVHEHEVCAGGSGQELGRKRVAGAADEALIGHSLYGPV